jgi:hypothetical protein
MWHDQVVQRQGDTQVEVHLAGGVVLRFVSLLIRQSQQLQFHRIKLPSLTLWMLNLVNR